MADDYGLQGLIEAVKRKGYASIKMYAENTHIRVLVITSTLHRKEFVVTLPERWRTNAPNHTLDQIENNYMSYRQRDYLSKISLTGVACFSDKNICIKNDTEFTCYILDPISDEGPSPKERVGENVDELEEEEDDDDNSLISDDIEIDDFAVGMVVPVFDYETFIKSALDFEAIVMQYHDIIRAAEEEMNSAEVDRIIQLFQGQEKLVKEKMFEIHKRSYHLRRDLDKYGRNLEKLYGIKERSQGEKDLVRFKIDRLIVETEERIDDLNRELMQGRDRADVMLKKYVKYIEAFTHL